MAEILASLELRIGIGVFLALCAYGFVSGAIRSLAAWFVLNDYYNFSKAIRFKNGNKEPSSIHVEAYLPLGWVGIQLLVVLLFLVLAIFVDLAAYLGALTTPVNAP